MKMGVVWTWGAHFVSDTGETCFVFCCVDRALVGHEEKIDSFL